MASSLGTVRREMLSQALVQCVQIGFRIQPQSDAPLIGHHNHLAAGAVEPGNRLLNSGQQFEALPGGHELAVGWFPVQHSVPIQENIRNICKIAGSLAAHRDYNFKQ